MLPAPRGPWAVGALILSSILGGGVLYVAQLRSEVRRHAADHLESVADLTARLVASWREERLSDALGIAAHPLVADVASRATTGSAKARQDLVEWCHSWLRDREYRTVAVFDVGGRSLAFAGPPPEEVHVQDMMPAGKAVLSDLHEDAAGVVHADLFVPLFLGGSGGRSQIGLAMMRAEPLDRLFSLIQPWPAPSHAGRTLLVRRSGTSVQVLLGARLRDGGDPAAERPPRRTYLPAAWAGNGEQGPGGGVDPRGRRVLTAVRPVPGTSWSLVAHMDEEEIYAPLRDHARWVLLLCAALGGAAMTGAVAWWRKQLGTFRACQREAELERLALEQHFAHLGRHTNDILLLADGGLRIVHANDRAHLAYGWDPEALLGKRLEDLLAPQERPGLAARLREIATGGGEVVETMHLRRDGSVFPAEASCRAIEIEGERYYQYVIRDLTEQRRTERALQRAEERLELALEVSQLGIWDWDVRRDEVYLSPTLLRMLGYSRAGLQGRDSIRGLLHPEDRAAASAKWQALVDGSEASLETEMRVLAKSGDWKRVLGGTRLVERSRGGRLLRVMGTLGILPESPARS